MEKEASRISRHVDDGRQRYLASHENDMRSAVLGWAGLGWTPGWVYITLYLIILYENRAIK